MNSLHGLAPKANALYGMWVALWVQRVWEKISLCVIILNRVLADSLSAKSGSPEPPDIISASRP